MAFPVSPVNGQIYNEYEYDSNLGLWRSVSLNTVGVNAGLSETANYTDAGSHQIVPYDSVDWESGGGFDAVSHTFTAPFSGVYSINAHIYLYPASNPEAFLYKNGSLFLRNAKGLSSTAVNPNLAFLNHCIFLNKDDYISIYVRTSETAAMYYPERATYLSIMQLSRQ